MQTSALLMRSSGVEELELASKKTSTRKPKMSIRMSFEDEEKSMCKGEQKIHRIMYSLKITSPSFFPP